MMRIFRHGFSSIDVTRVRGGVNLLSKSAKSDFEHGEEIPVPWFDREDFLPVTSAKIIRVGYDAIVIEEVVGVGSPRRWLIDLDEDREPVLVNTIEGFALNGVGQRFTPREIAVI